MHRSAHGKLFRLRRMTTRSFQLFKEFGVGRQLASPVEVFQELLHILHGIHDAVQLKAQAPFRFQLAVADQAGHRVVCGVIIIEHFVELPDEFPLPALTEPKLAVRWRGPQVDQQSARSQDAMRFLQGMNHALRGHSSEGPGEDGDVE